MAFGVPVVATSLAIEGMALQNAEDILVADEPEDFARAMVELYESEDIWNRISENGVKKTCTLYSTDTARKNLALLFSDEHLRRLERSVVIAQPDLAIAGQS
jgi:glycosyltransferase involved in cell wall biosynthesis